MEGGRYYEQRELLYVAISRFLSTPAFVGLTLAAGDEISTALALTLVAGVGYTSSSLALAASRHWARVDPRVFAVGDMAALAAVMLLSGGPESQVKIVFFLWPIGLALLFAPRQLIWCLLGAIATFGLASLPFVLDGPLSFDDPQLRALALTELSLAWIGSMAIFAAYSFARRRDRIERLSEARRNLLTDALSAEERSRRRLSQGIERGPLQVLLSAGQDLDDGLRGDGALLTRAREGIRTTVGQLREIVREIHPTTFEKGGLAAGLDALVERAARESGFAADVRVDPAASGSHDALLTSVTRELAAGAGRQGVRELSLELRCEEGTLVLEVTEEGAGFAGPEADDQAIATCRERIEAVGGRFEVLGADERRRSIRAVLPASAQESDSEGLGRADQQLYDRSDLVRVAMSRALSVPLFLALLAVASEPVSLELALLIGGAALYVGGSLIWAHRGRITGRRVASMVGIDLAVMAAVMAASGGPRSQMTVIFFIWPISLSLLFSPRTIFGCLVASIAVFGLVSVPFVAGAPFDLNDPDVRALVLAELSLLWVGTITVAGADAFHRRTSRIASLSAMRQKILADALAAEDRARRQMSLALHDDALQVLLAAGQDLDDGLRGSDDSVERAREEMRLATSRLRDTARGLDPAAVEHGGLATGLDAVAERAGRMGGLAVDVRVDPDAAGFEDDLILALAQELSINAAKHSKAENLKLNVARVDGTVELVVTDDGRGIRTPRLDAALADGHIGLASCIERVEARGGTLTIDTPEGGGARVGVCLPAREARRGAAAPGSA